MPLIYLSAFHPCLYNFLFFNLLLNVLRNTRLLPFLKANPKTSGSFFFMLRVKFDSIGLAKCK